MEIFWRGHSCFSILIKQNKEENIKIVIDPFDESIGLPLREEEADILLISHNHPDHNNTKIIKDEPFKIEGPGEYEIKGIYIEGIEAFHDNKKGKERGKVTIFTIEGEQIRLCHLSDIGQKELTDQQLEKIGEVDILMVPVGGIYTISPKEAVDIISQIEPKIVIPMHYFLPKMKIKLEKVDKFLKEMRIEEPERLKSLKIKQKDLPSETKVVLLKLK